MAKLNGKGTITELVKGEKYRIKFSGGKDPATGKYIQVKETFLGTKRQAELRVEGIRRECELRRDLGECGLSLDELAGYGLTLAVMVERGMGAAQAADELKRRKDEESKKVLFSDWLEQYLSNRESLGKLRPKTLKRDRDLSKHLLRGLGSVLVVDITPAMVNAFNASMRDSGVGDTTIKQCHRLLKTVMKQAVNNDLILRNPVERADTPKNPIPNRQWLETSEANRLSTLCASGTPTANKTAVFLALATGARLGEVLGLTWAHIALDGARPHVFLVQQWTEQNELAPLKTDKDENPVGRVIPIDASTIAVLRAWKSEQRRLLNSIGIEQGNSSPVITNQNGTFTNHSRFQRWWRSFCVDNGFGRVVADDGREIVTLTLGDDASLYPDSDFVIEWRDSDGWPCDENGKRYSRSYKKPKTKKRYDGLHFHALRHTHFSLRRGSGVDDTTLQYLGGWSSPAMLMNVYAHPVAENIWASAGFMDRLTSEKQTA